LATKGIKSSEETSEEPVVIVENVENKSTEVIKKFVYIGPVIKKGLYPTGKVVSEHFKDELGEELKKVPTLKKLFIPLEKFTEVQKQLDNPNNIYQKFIKDVISNGI